MAVSDALMDNRLMIPFAFLLAMLTGGLPALNPEVVIISLVVMMSISLGGLESDVHTSSGMGRTLIHVAAWSIVSGGTALIAMALSPEGMREGWALIVAVPSAVSIIPSTLVMRGDVRGSTVSTTVIYLASMVTTPLVALALLGTEVSVWSLAQYSLTFILLPFIVSRLIGQRPGHVGRVSIINICYMALVIAGVGPSRDFIIDNPWTVAVVAAVCTARVFGTGLIVEGVLRRLRIERAERVPVVLFSTWKNTGMAMALAVALVGESAGIPAAISIAVEMIWYMTLSSWVYPHEDKLIRRTVD